MSSRIFLIAFLLCGYLIAQSEISVKTSPGELPFGIKILEPADYPKIGIAMSGGGARAISQVGILNALENNNIKIDYITGTSMGSVIGGMYSVGYSIEDIDSILTTTDWNEFISINETNREDLFVDEKITEDRAIVSIRFDGFSPVIPTSLNTGQRVLNYLNSIFANAPVTNFNRFSDLVYNFKAVATDIVNGNTVVLDEGSIARSLRASSSVSFLLPPVVIDSLLLADGGLVANVPVKVAKQSGADIVIAFNTTSSLREAEELNTPWTIADQVVSIPMNILTEQQLKEADAVVQPYLGGKKNDDFSNLRDIIQLGYESFSSHSSRVEQIQKEFFYTNYDDEVKFYKNLKAAENDLFAQNLLAQFNEVDSVANYEIEYLLNKEYLLGDYRSISLSIDDDNGSSLVTSKTELNAPIRKCNVIGSSMLGVEDIKKFSDAVCSRPYNGKRLLTESLKLLSVYKSKGYTLASIDKIDFHEETGILNVTLLEGIIGEIKIFGNDKTNETVIRRELPFEAGEPLLYDKLVEGLENLRITNLFDEVDLVIKKDSNRNFIELHLKEKLSTVLRFGLKIDNEYFTQFLFDIRDENLYGSGSEIGLSFFAGPRNRSVTVEQKASRIFDTYLTYSLKGFYYSTDINTYSDVITNNERKFEREKTGEYKQRNYGGSVGLGAQFKKFGTVYGEFTYQRNQIANMLNDPESEYLQNISSLKFGFKIDSRDKLPFPVSGFLIDSYYETSQKFLSAEIAYSKFFIDYNHYFSLNTLHTFHLRGMLGFGDETLPLSQQFAFGGQSSFAGYRQFEFRGRQIFISSLGYRFKLPVHIFFDTYVGVRYDLGSIWSKQEQIKFKNLRHAVSATMSFDTPIGPADFSVAKSFLFKNDPPNSIVSYGETFFYFNIGFTY